MFQICFLGSFKYFLQSFLFITDSAEGAKLMPYLVCWHVLQFLTVCQWQKLLSTLQPEVVCVWGKTNSRAQQDACECHQKAGRVKPNTRHRDDSKNTYWTHWALFIYKSDSGWNEWLFRSSVKGLWFVWPNLTCQRNRVWPFLTPWMCHISQIQ